MQNTKLYILYDLDIIKKKAWKYCWKNMKQNVNSSIYFWCDYR